jgi:UDP-N-acetylglucosamine 4,6-dehydratase
MLSSQRYCLQKNDFTCNTLGEIGKPVPQGFEYSSDLNSEWLKEDGLLKMVESI